MIAASVKLSAFAITISLLAAGTASPVRASDDCANASAQSTMTECYGKALVAIDKELNENFRKIEKRLGDDADTRKRLVAAERAWVAFRDAECGFSTSAAEGGSLYPMTLAICRTELTRQRNEQLKAYLACEEGDVSCPVPPQ